MCVMTSLVVLPLLLGHCLQCSCPPWVLQQEGASLRCWSALWFSASTSIKGRAVPLLFVWAGTVLHGEGLLMAQSRAWDCQSSPKLDYSNVKFEKKSATSSVPALARYSVQSVFMWVMPLLFVSLCCYSVLWSFRSHFSFSLMSNNVAVWIIFNILLPPKL